MDASTAVNKRSPRPASGEKAAPVCIRCARFHARPSHEGYPFGGWRPNVLEVANICVVVLDPRVAPRDQTAWAFTDDADAQAMAGFLNARLGGGEEVAWVEVVPLARKLNKRVLRYLDCWAHLAEETFREDE